MVMPLDVACLGILVADMLARTVEEIPPPGELRLVQEMGLHVGGCAANTAVGLARLGVRTGVLGKVGSDALGDFLLRSLVAEGVETSGVCVDGDTATSATVALVAGNGERAFLHAVGGNGRLHANEVDLEGTGPARILHVGGAGLMPSLDGAPLAGVCARARSLGMTVSLDTAWNPSGQWENVRVVLRHVDYFLPSIEEAQRILGEETPEAIADAAMELGVAVVVIKMGHRGCYVHRGPGATGTYIPAIAVEVADTTGAGDAFCAGFLAAVVRGWSVERCARAGNAVGALAVRAAGAVEGIRSWQESVALMEAPPSRSVV